tara:strand:+ start:5405 stop:5884 length:480 start_codon:yes stop_codon:yes gene_type:complete
MRMKADLNGTKELEALLSKLPDKMGAKVLKKSMREATKPMVKAAKALVPVKTGKLKKSIKVKDSRKKVKGNHAVLFGTLKSTPYAHLVELGTQRHVITPESSRFLKIFGTYTKEVVHPGTRPRPFLRPAFDREKGNWFKLLGKSVYKNIDKEVKKMRKL